MIPNPYEPATATDVAPGLRDWDRDQCPFCLHRQSIWKAINAVRIYRCRQCQQALTVILPRVLAWAGGAMILATFIGFIIYHYVYHFRPHISISGLGLIGIASWFLLRYWFGYFHPAGRRSIRTRRELDSILASKQEQTDR